MTLAVVDAAAYGALSGAAGADVGGAQESGVNRSGVEILRAELGGARPEEHSGSYRINRYHAKHYGWSPPTGEQKTLAAQIRSSFRELPGAYRSPKT